MTDLHRYFFHIDDGDVHFRVVCGHDKTDETRPCWPYEDGGAVREPPPQKNCTYVDWAENTMPEEILHGSVEVEIDCKPDWSDGEGLVLHVLGLRGSSCTT